MQGPSLFHSRWHPRFDLSLTHNPPLVPDIDFPGGHTHSLGDNMRSRPLAGELLMLLRHRHPFPLPDIQRHRPSLGLALLCLLVQPHQLSARRILSWNATASSASCTTGNGNASSKGSRPNTTWNGDTPDAAIVVLSRIRTTGNTSGHGTLVSDCNVQRDSNTLCAAL